VASVCGVCKRWWISGAGGGMRDLGIEVTESVHDSQKG